MTSHKMLNKLVNEKSPYLLQHAYNTVDWYPWGPEAFSKAVSEDKPISFLLGISDVGYSTLLAIGGKLVTRTKLHPYYIYKIKGSI